MLNHAFILLVSILYTVPIHRRHLPEVEDLSTLTMDSLIERLPPVREDWSRGEDGWRLLPPASEIKTRIDRGDPLTSEQWLRALQRTGALRSRNRWPKDESFALSMRKPAWLQVTQIRLVPRWPGWKPAELGLLYQSTCGTFS